jgi:hypothetical protein
MLVSMAQEDCEQITAPVTAAIDGLVGLDPDTLGDAELAEAVVELRRQQARLAAATARVTASFEARRIYAADGSRSAGAWLAHRCRLPVGQTRAETWLGRRLRAIAVTAGAFAAGDISGRHATVLAGLAGGRTAGPFAAAEATLVDWARSMAWGEFCQAIEYWRQAADPDGVERDAAHDQARRRVHLSAGLRGTGILDGLLTPLGYATVDAALRRIEHELFDADRAAARTTPVDQASACHPTRTPAQRRHDALVELARRALTAPADGKRPPPLISVLVGYETFKGRIWQLAAGTVVTPGTVASLLDEALIERVVFDGPSRVIDLGRARRFTGAARRALEVVDQHCGHPGCDQPADRCQGDHIQAWTTDGPTNPDNGQLRCGYHNRWRWQHPHPNAPPAPNPDPPPSPRPGTDPHPDADRQQRITRLEDWRTRLRATIAAETASHPSDR